MVTVGLVAVQCLPRRRHFLGNPKITTTATTSTTTTSTTSTSTGATTSTGHGIATGHPRQIS